MLKAARMIHENVINRHIQVRYDYKNGEKYVKIIVREGIKNKHKETVSE